VSPEGYAQAKELLDAGLIRNAASVEPGGEVKLTPVTIEVAGARVVVTPDESYPTNWGIPYLRHYYTPSSYTPTNVEVEW
jgi:hypothetical protein